MTLEELTSATALASVLTDLAQEYTTVRVGNRRYVCNSDGTWRER